MKSEIKENIQGTNSEGKETGTQINDLEWRKKETFNQNRMKKQAFKKMRRGLGTSGTTLNIPTWIIGVPEGEEEEQEVENLLEQIMKELPQSGKGNRLPGSPGSSDSPTQVGPKEAHTRARHNYISQG